MVAPGIGSAKTSKQSLGQGHARLTNAQHLNRVNRFAALHGRGPGRSRHRYAACRSFHDGSESPRLGPGRSVRSMDWCAPRSGDGSSGDRMIRSRGSADVPRPFPMAIVVVVVIEGSRADNDNDNDHERPRDFECAALAGRRALQPQSLHARLQGGGLDPQTLRRPAGATNAPAGLLK